MVYKNFIFLGTSHISKQSLEEVESSILTEKPDFVALELDEARFHAIMQPQKPDLSIRNALRFGIKGYIFALLGAWAEKKLGELTGVPPGSEMKHAILLAKQHNIKIALVDQHIETTLRRFSKSITWKEKFNFAMDMLKAVFSKKRKAEFDIRKVPEEAIIKKLLSQVKKRYPNVYKVLITERNKAISQNLINLSSKNPDKRILVVLGAGHISDVVKILKKHCDKQYVKFNKSGVLIV